MTSNAYVALKRLLPPSSLLVGKVTAHHTDDETSTVVLPTQQGVNEYAAGVATGSTIRARGTFVPVGANAFVRDGVIESRAPDENASEIVIGAVVPVPMPLTFNGPIPDQTATVGAAVAVDLTGYWSGGTPPLAYALGAGTLPAGMTVGSGGSLGGTPSAAGLSPGVVVRATDRTGLGANSNAFAVDVTPAVAPVGFVDTFTTPGLLTARSGDSGVAWQLYSGNPAHLVVQDGGVSQPSSVGWGSPTFQPVPASFQPPTATDLFIEGELLVPLAGYAGSDTPGFYASFLSSLTPGRYVNLELGRLVSQSDTWVVNCRWVAPGVNVYLQQLWTSPIALSAGGTLAWRMELRAGSTHGRLLLNGSLVAERTDLPQIDVTDTYWFTLTCGRVSAPFGETLRLGLIRVGALS